MSTFKLSFAGVEDAIVCEVSVAQSDDVAGKGFVRCRALWDTGAVYTVVSRRLAAALGLSAIDQSMATTVQGSYLASVYLLDLLLPNRMMVKALRVSDGEFDDCDILIGMDVIKLGDFQITNKDHTVFTFQIPAEGTIA